MIKDYKIFEHIVQIAKSFFKIYYSIYFIRFLKNVLFKSLVSIHVQKYNSIHGNLNWLFKLF